MKLSPISFCNRTAYNLVNDTDKDHILDLLYNKYKIAIGDNNHKVYKSNKTWRIKNADREYSVSDQYHRDTYFVSIYPRNIVQN